MVYIKRLVIHGFKSFARRTEVDFDKGINVVLGPNGSGKSNISDALCFVLGRMSMKSMRAAKAKNMIFMGSKFVKPAHEASVELVFDNSDRAFSIESDEIILKRILRRNGQGIYKINDETKTRTEVIEMLAQAGIDPYGFNMVLQGQIQSIVKMHPEERRKIIDEVAGIAVYEAGKEKALKELEKTDERLKEISTILRERTAHLRNLEKEKAQAQRFKELELIVKRAKASILQKRLEDKEKELSSINKSVAEKTEHKEKIREKGEKLRGEIETLGQKIMEINRHIQQATGLEQESLNNQIANLRADIEGIKVRKENFEHRKVEIERRIEEMNKGVPELETEIVELRKESPVMAQKAEELRRKKEELQELGEERKRLITLRGDLNSHRERIKDRERQLGRLGAESESILRQLEEYSSKLNYKGGEECAEAILSLRSSLAVKKKEQDSILKQELENEKILSISEAEIERVEKIKADVGRIDVCPLCQSKITEEHIKHVNEEADSKVKEHRDKLENSKNELAKLKEMKEKIVQEVRTFGDILSHAEIEIIKHKTLKEKKEQLKKVLEEEKNVRKEINELEEKRKNLEGKAMDLSKIEEKYDSKILEIEEISSRTKADTDTSLLFKEREIEKLNLSLKQSRKDLEDVENNIEDYGESLKVKSKMLEEKEKQNEDLTAKFKKMFEERDGMQKEVQDKNLTLSEIQSEVRQFEEQVNYLRIGKAKFDAERESIEMEQRDYSGIELLTGSMNVLEERQKKAVEALGQIGSINMRALEVYEDIKKEYDAVQVKVETLEKEKLDILKVIEEIDTKKRRTFMRTFRAMNELFTQNFSKLYTKGIAFLEMENKEDIFSGGVNIVVKLAKGKYFDVTSLSGGEQTLVALSLLFAIQEYKPYHFYVFDEIDAALDKRNSERLAGLLNQYMKGGQYLVITHNDAIIMNANVLYGVSMHEGVSKILSLEIKEEVKKQFLGNQIEEVPLNEPKEIDESNMDKTPEELQKEVEEAMKERAEMIINEESLDEDMVKKKVAGKKKEVVAKTSMDGEESEEIEAEESPENSDEEKEEKIHALDAKLEAMDEKLELEEEEGE